jgi:hypothetical protein
MESTQNFERELCNNTATHAPCPNVTPYCDKLHICKDLQETHEYAKAYTICMYGEYCDQVTCTHFHLITGMPNNEEITSISIPFVSDEKHTQFLEENGLYFYNPTQKIPNDACSYKEGTKFTTQEWRNCVDCFPNKREGACIFCLKTCHKGHRLGPLRHSPFFCDCNCSKTNVTPSNNTNFSPIPDNTCSFSITGKETFVHQKWRHCNDCFKKPADGACLVCSETCHKGHNLGPIRESLFFCDCQCTTAH